MRILRNTISVILTLFFIYSCSTEDNSENIEASKSTEQYKNVEDVWYAGKTTIQGKTQGTTFTIKTSEDTLLSSPKEMSELLKNFDLQLSGYIPNSVLTKFNDLGANNLMDISPYPEFRLCYEISQEIFKRTDGAFDPSVFPLVKVWGFFKEMNDPPSSSEVDSILTFTGFGNGAYHTFENNQLKKLDARFEIDFNAIAQGLSVDYIAEHLEQKGHQHYFIEIGGEIRTKGINNEGSPWVIGIDQPNDDNTGLNKRDLENYLGLQDISVATSGNYRKFYEKDGKRYSHTLDPHSGYPVKHNLLSTTVISKSAAVADGYATAFMTMGVEKTMNFVKNNPDLNLEVYLLFENENGRIERAYSEGLANYFIE